MLTVRSRSSRIAMAALAVLFALAQLAHAQAPAPATVAQLRGTWTSDDWGTIELGADGHGSYASTYGTGPGRIALRPAGGRRFVGTWGESAQRHGTLTIELAPDGRTVTGTWTPDPSCTIGDMSGGPLAWTRH